MANPSIYPPYTGGPSPLSGTSTYYYNSRGLNYVPFMKNEWEKSGYMPRYPTAVMNAYGLALGQSWTGYDVSSVFYGTNKTSQWWYYNHDDNVLGLNYLRSIGINSIRVFTDIYVWNRDKTKFLDDVKDFMKLCDELKIRVQLVILDGIEAAAPTQPQNRAQTVSSVEHGLLSSWHMIPHAFEVSSVAQTDNFFTTCATPFMNELWSTVSGFQSMWCIDLLNEFSLSGQVRLASAIGYYMRPYLSATNVGLTIGFGAGYDPYSGVLNNGRGTGPGGTYGHYPNAIYQLSDVLTFGTIHCYQNNRYGLIRYINEAISGAAQNGLPAMYNENTGADLASWYFDQVPTLEQYKFGGLAFDAMIDWGESNEPFADSQGIYFWDGQVRSSKEASGYLTRAILSNWFSESQLVREIIQKEYTSNSGYDGGYYSGVIPEHLEFNAQLYTSADPAIWENTKTIKYTLTPLLQLVPANTSQNFNPPKGHPNSKSFEITYNNEVLVFSDLVSRLNDFDTLFPPLSSFPNTGSGPDFEARNRSIVLRDLLIVLLTNYLTDTNPGLPAAELIGSQYDYNPVDPTLRLNFSSLFHQYLRVDGSSIALGIKAPKPSTYTSASMPCVVTNTCIYNTPGNPSTGIDFAAYDAYYEQLKDYTVQIINDMMVAGETNDWYKLY